MYTCRHNRSESDGRGGCKCVGGYTQDLDTITNKEDVPKCMRGTNKQCAKRFGNNVEFDGGCERESVCVGVSVCVCVCVCVHVCVWVAPTNNVRNASEMMSNSMVSHRIAAHCNTLQHTAQFTATHCNTLQHTATHCNTLHNSLQHTATHCNAMQHTATHCTTHCNTLQHNATHCNTLQHTIHCNTLHGTKCAKHFGNDVEFDGVTPYHIAAHCNKLQHTATHCNTHCYTHCIKLQHIMAVEGVYSLRPQHIRL